MPKTKKYRLRFLFQEIDLVPGVFCIGRSPSCNLTLEDPLVSRNHVRLNVLEDAVTIDDLGSRNGTMVNGEPVFDGHILHSKDRIRVGSHEMVFLEEVRFPSKQMRVTGTLMVCPACKVPFPAGGSTCPHCSAIVIPDESCPRCRLVVDPTHEFCSRCGTKLEPKEDPTIPVDLGGRASQGGSSTVSQVIEKAIETGKYGHAAKLLEGKEQEYELSEGRGSQAVSLLLEISGYNATLARELRQPERFTWIIDKWSAVGTPMPIQTLDTLLSSASGWHDLAKELDTYIKTLNDQGDNSEECKALVGRLENADSGGSD